jgi:pimeloyl-ACP methyl ester carboxylesterase
MTLEWLRYAAKSQPNRHPPLLFMHGSYSSARLWSVAFMPYFSEKGYDCHALSARGHGTSDGILSWVSLSDYVEDLCNIASQMPSPPILIGHSIGGLVAQHALATIKPKAAVMVASFPPSGAGSSAMHMSLVAPDLLWQLGLLQTLGPHAVSPDVMARAYLSKNPAKEDVLELMTLLQRGSSRLAGDLLAPALPTAPQAAEKLPILVLGGDSDLFLPVSAFRETASYYHAELRIFPGAPHGLMLDKQWWQTVADTILTWFAQHSL